MNSWQREIKAVFRKELASELRTRSGLATVALFSIAAVVAVAFAAFNIRLGGSLASGLLWVTLLFTAAVALPRAFVTEEEQGTGDLLRLIARPEAVFWGKALYNLGLMLVTGLILSLLFFTMIGRGIEHPVLYLICLIGSCASLAGAVTLCGALVAQAAGRGALAGAIAIPLLLPLVALGVAGMRVALGEGALRGGEEAAFGLVCYGVATLAIGPALFAAVWKS
ncbi:MAG: heme exporter protein [Fimbriimonadaceae bacterium]|jgi:heme exporter protein B|nr:heme exporter protein [Fimbriimonadaceae bacterium]